MVVALVQVMRRTRSKMEIVSARMFPADLTLRTKSPTADFTGGTYMVGHEVGAGLWRISNSVGTFASGGIRTLWVGCARCTSRVPLNRAGHVGTMIRSLVRSLRDQM